ncbi:Relaxase/Mobilisation nuclease domain-containing protein [Epilithonimonas bovis DSM 19482]|uniref:Relaxase/Mobilisation nuclease domain-containing protein n=1 Tax=Epilithonimonas bovis DSM 19482 TaxID=1121284 RepID=A0A1U7PV51_9FLAO|nr:MULTISPECIES: relaxase/mobilization nuclease domain-containing protein [Chryseobacterium group]MPS65116.1 relaxase [Chryseobacterium sp.]SIT97435.1 Relaxase/Mobilisation nuclease domain-containing protein [Epilithonimonas bovis DSM 19482]
MNNSATTRRISKIALEYNGNDKGKAEMVFSQNLLNDNPEKQFLEMKTIADRNSNVKKWAFTGYISPEKSIGDQLSNEELVKLTLKALKKVGVTEQNQIRLDIHSSTKQKHIHFVVNRIAIQGNNTIKAHKIGDNFGKAVREVCKEMNLKTDVEIGIEKKKQMLNDLKFCLKTAENFDELIQKMHQLNYRVTLSENIKVGVSGMRIVRNEDINNETQRQYKPGYKLSEITTKLKIVDIKNILDANHERESLKSEFSQNSDSQSFENNATTFLSEIGKFAENLLKPTFTTPDDELLKKKRRKF